MSNGWTTDQVLALAPDAASASAGRKLAGDSNWTGLGRSARAVWGLCQGSGKNPYQTRVDLAEPAFKCSCPSRKFPCKHGIGLMLLLASQPKVLVEAAEPGWVAEWLAGRSERAEKKSEQAAEAAAKPVDVEAQAKRSAKREERVRAGAAECLVWLEDVARRGLAATQGEAGSFWERAAARMVDAQAPGLARLIRRMPGIIASGDGWHRRAVSHLGRLYLLARAGERLAELPADLAGDARTALGWAQAKEEAAAAAGVADRWCVVGQAFEEEDRVRSRRTWLVGEETRRRALLLDFSVGSAGFERAVVVGTSFEAALGFYPSRLPVRAVIKGQATGARAISAAALVASGIGGESVRRELRAFAEATAVLPWLERGVMMLGGVTPVRTGRGDGERWLVRDESGACLPLREAAAEVWQVLAVSGGRPVGVCGEWNGEVLSVLSVWAWEEAGELVDVAARWAA